SGSIGLGAVTQQTAAGKMVAPLVVAGDTGFASLTGAGVSPIAVFSSGKLTVSGDVSNTAASGNSPSIQLSALGALSVSGTVQTRSSARSGRISLSGNDITVSGSD